MLNEFPRMMLWMIALLPHQKLVESSVLTCDIIDSLQEHTHPSSSTPKDFDYLEWLQRWERAR